MNKTVSLVIVAHHFFSFSGDQFPVIAVVVPVAVLVVIIVTTTISISILIAIRSMYILQGQNI